MNLPVIGITGSAGKTTTKEMTASIFKTRWKNVLKSEQSNNCWLDNYIKLLNPSHQAVILEYSIHRIQQNCELLKPTMVAITNITAQHIQDYDGRIERIIDGKSKIFKYMNQSGTLFLNADDPLSRKLDTNSFGGTIFSVGLTNRHAHYVAYDIIAADTGVKFTVDLNGKKEPIFIPALGKHNVYNALFALGFADKLGFTADEIRQGLSSYEVPFSRLQIHRANENIIIDDSFNSSLIANIAAIEVLANFNNSMKIAILGPTLGGLHGIIDEHIEIGQQIAKQKIDLLFTLHPKAKNIGMAAIHAGYPEEKVKHSNEHNELIEQLNKIIHIPNLTFLVKGSMGLKMSRTVTYLKKVCALQALAKNRYLLANSCNSSDQVN